MARGTFKNSPKLSAMKYEIASQFGLGNYQTIDKGSLTSRQNGSVGGQITKTLVAQALGESPTTGGSGSSTSGSGSSR